MDENVSITKKQHYVPKAYLSFFATKERTALKTYAFFRTNKVKRYVDIDDICCEKLLYEQKIDDPIGREVVLFEPNTIENLFVDIEGHYHTICEKIIQMSNDDEFCLTNDERKWLEIFISSLTLRCAESVKLANELSEFIYSKSQKEILEIKRKIDENIPDNVMKAYFKQIALDNYINPKTSIYVRTHKKMLEDSQVVLLKTEGLKFITSNHPNKMFHKDKTGMEFDFEGIAISPELMLAFVDDAISLPNIIVLNDEIVSRINCVHIKSSAKCLIAKNIKDIDMDFYEPTLEIGV